MDERASQTGEFLDTELGVREAGMTSVRRLRFCDRPKSHSRQNGISTPHDRVRFCRPVIREGQGPDFHVIAKVFGEGRRQVNFDEMHRIANIIGAKRIVRGSSARRGSATWLQ